MIHAPNHRSRLALAAVAFAFAGPAFATDIPLASTMDPASFASESTFTGAFSRIGEGNGDLGSAGANTGDADGLYNVANLNAPNPGSPFGAVDLFPREADFLVGGITVDTSSLTGVGVETVPLTALDFSELWKPDASRTASVPGTPPTVVSDISDQGIGLWLFNAPGGISVSNIPTSEDTATFTDGLLTSIDVVETVEFIVFGGATPTVWTGSLTIAGDQISLQINDTQALFGSPSTIVFDVTGTVNAVDSFVIPEPASAAIAAMGGGLIAARRKRRHA